MEFHIMSLGDSQYSIETRIKTKPTFSQAPDHYYLVIIIVTEEMFHYELILSGYIDNPCFLIASYSNHSKLQWC